MVRSPEDSGLDLSSDSCLVLFHWMVGVAQLVRAPDCDSGCRGFESGHPPFKSFQSKGLQQGFFG